MNNIKLSYKDIKELKLIENWKGCSEVHTITEYKNLKLIVMNDQLKFGGNVILNYEIGIWNNHNLIYPISYFKNYKNALKEFQFLALIQKGKIIKEYK